MNSSASFTSQHSRPRGAGIAYRYSIHDEIMAHRDRIDLLEVSTEDYIVRERRLGADSEMRKLNEAVSAFPSVAHGISLSLGTVEAPPSWYLEATRRLLSETGMEIFSEHLAFHSVDGNDLTMFLAMPFADEAIAWLVEKYQAVRASLGRSFALENVTYHFAVPHCPWSEADFFRQICDRTDASLLLDVTNLFNNSENHGYDAGEFLDRYPLERVSQIHLAGGFVTEEGKWEDSHSEPVMEPVWELFEEVMRRTAAEIVILERDSKLQPFDRVIADVDRAREIFWRYRQREVSGGRLFGRENAPGDEAPFVNPDSPAFAQLKGFQRAMMARITSADFRGAYDENPREAVAKLGLADELWRKRLAHCDPASLDRLAKSWAVVEEQEAEVQSDYETSEWAAWASQLAETEADR